MPGYSNRGNQAERFLVKWLTERGWLCASRRHIKGAGDILAVLPETGKVWLIEVKKCAPARIWENFRRTDRIEMLETPLPPGGERFLVNIVSEKDGGELAWYGPESWPRVKETDDAGIRTQG